MPYADPHKQKEYQRQWYNNRRTEWLKENGPCVLCGSDKNLEVDHIDPQEKISHRIWSWSTPRRESELAKCQVLCADCHLIKSKEDWKTCR